MPHTRKTAGVILAAGMSRRFGHPKQLIKLQEKNLLGWVLEAALASRLAKIVLVLGHAHEQIRQVLGADTMRPGLEIVINHRYSEGQSRSLQVGLQTVLKSFDSVMFLLGDQPRLRTATIDHLLAHFWKSDKNICVPVQGGVRGNPTIFSRTMYGELMAIRGDIGARQVIAKNPDQVLAVETGEPTEFIDIDSPADLLRFD